MERHIAELLKDAFALPDEGRAALIDSLIESVDRTVDEGAEEAWKREIHLRLQHIDSRAAQLIPWPAARLRLSDRLERFAARSFESTLPLWTKLSPLSTGTRSEGCRDVLDELERAIEQIGENPGVEIIAIARGRRRPRYWRDQVEQRWRAYGS